MCSMFQVKITFRLVTVRLMTDVGPANDRCWSDAWPTRNDVQYVRYDAHYMRNDAQYVRTDVHHMRNAV